MAPLKAEPLLPIPSTELPNFIGKRIHLSWAPPGCTWVLKQIDGNTLYLETPKTKKKLTAHARDALYIRRYEPTV